MGPSSISSPVAEFTNLLLPTAKCIGEEAILFSAHRGFVYLMRTRGSKVHFICMCWLSINILSPAPSAKDDSRGAVRPTHDKLWRQTWTGGSPFLRVLLSADVSTVNSSLLSHACNYCGFCRSERDGSRQARLELSFLSAQLLHWSTS